MGSASLMVATRIGAMDRKEKHSIQALQKTQVLNGCPRARVRKWFIAVVIISSCLMTGHEPA
jgi:hypothetical protein